MPIPFSPKAEAKKIGAIPYLLRAAGQTNLSMYFVMPGVLIRRRPWWSGDSILPGHTPARAGVAHPLLQYTLITDLYRAYLYDVRAERACCSTRTIQNNLPTGWSLSCRTRGWSRGSLRICADSPAARWPAGTRMGPAVVHRNYPGKRPRGLRGQPGD